MTRIVISRYCPKRPATKQLRLALAQIIVTSDLSFLSCLAVSILLAGCAENARPSEEYLAGNGYWYHDGNHPGGGGAQASSQAIANAIHGTWLWPPTAGRGP
jgi:hypothetical protein